MQRSREKTTAFGYDLPDDRFRQPYMAQRVQVTFEAEDVPAIGYQVYVLKEVEESLAKDIHELIETTDATSKDKEFVMEMRMFLCASTWMEALI